MALLNKLFTTNRRSNGHAKGHNVSEKLFAFSKDQVRVVLFRECDFRGRKLLFDSHSPRKSPLCGAPSNEDTEKCTNLVINLLSKSQADSNQLSEMVFGSVAMSFRGTNFKVHVLDSPNRLMFTQVFSSPRQVRHNGRVSSRSEPQNLAHSNKLDDSGASSSNSMSEHLSVHSTTSDTILVCRRHRSSPLDVPGSFFNSNLSLVGDSGYCADNSNSNISSVPSSAETGNSMLSLSSGSIYRKILRRNGTSVENTTSGFSFNSLGSGQEHFVKGPRTSKLGLSFILQLTPEKEEALSQFLMEHVCLLEGALWRARRVVEGAYSKSHNFTPLMVEMAEACKQYLVNLLSGSYISTNLWLALSSGCDNINSISAFSGSSNDLVATFSRDKITSSLPDMGFFNFTRKLKQDFSSDFDYANWKKQCNERGSTADKFLREFCELLESIDVKDTNFFISTLLTAVLTHHLGWVNTCLPPHNQHFCDYQPFNPLWSELSDLFGAAGHPTKTAQTIVTGSAKRDLVSKILLSMTYFIRCCDVYRRVPIRADIHEENRIVEAICQKYSCIPKENYKKYNLREIMNFNVKFSKKNVEQDSSNNNGDMFVPKKNKGLARTKTCDKNLGEMGDCCYKYEPPMCSGFGDVFESKKKTTLKRVSTKNALSALDQLSTEKDTESVFQDVENKDVVFFLGDNEKLIGLRNKTDEPFASKFQFDETESEEGDFLETSDDGSSTKSCMLKPSTSWTSLCNAVSCKSSECCSRSQSVPPEERKTEATSQAKHPYSGVKFNLQQYPQILSNYMKSKNLEISNLQFGEKGLKIDELSSLSDTINAKYPSLDSSCEDWEALQTPSNASELEFTSDLEVTPPEPVKAKETTVEPAISKKTFLQQHVANTILKEVESKKSRKISMERKKMNIVNLPMPKSDFLTPLFEPIRYSSSLMRAPADSYMPGMVLQAPISSKSAWEFKLKSDLALFSQHSLIDQPIEEAVAIIANTDTWEVTLMSSHTFVIDKGSPGIRVGMSQLIANMLESLLQLWKLNVPPHFCLVYIERSLQELYVRSKALAELLLASEFCSMEKLTSTLQLEVNDVPLLLAVASTHTPQVTEKYGLSFQ